jgi:hypothetical protein
MLLSSSPVEQQPEHRDRCRLHVYLHWIWQTYFIDTPCVNEVSIDYYYPWKSRLGLIRLSIDQKKTFIGINSLLQIAQVPESVLIITIAHELTHYAYGFGSPLPRRCEHPHANRIVDRELERRRLGEHLQQCNEWIDKQWYTFYDIERMCGWANIASSGRTAHRKNAARQ